jgi:hypothetical protein
MVGTFPYKVNIYSNLLHTKKQQWPLLKFQVKEGKGTLK